MTVKRLKLIAMNIKNIMTYIEVIYVLDYIENSFISQSCCSKTLTSAKQTKKGVLKKVPTVFIYAMKVSGVQHNIGPHKLSLHRQNQ